MSVDKPFKINKQFSVPKLAFIIIQFTFMVLGALQFEFIYQLEIPFYTGGWILIFALINFLLYTGHFLENMPSVSLTIEEKPEKRLIVKSGRFRKKQITLKLSDPHYIEYGKPHLNVSWSIVLCAQLWLAYYLAINGLELILGTAYEQGFLLLAYGLSMFILILISWFNPDVELIFSDGKDNLIFLLPMMSIKSLKNKSFLMDLERFLNGFKQIGDQSGSEVLKKNNKNFVLVGALVFTIVLAALFKFYYYQFVDVFATALLLLSIRRYVYYGDFTQKNIHPTETAIWLFLLNEMAFKIWYIIGVGISSTTYFNLLFIIIAAMAYILCLFAFWLRINKWWSTTTPNKKICALIGLIASIAIPLLNLLSVMQVIPFYFTVLNINPPV